MLPTVNITSQGIIIEKMDVNDYSNVNLKIENGTGSLSDHTCHLLSIEISIKLALSA